MPPVLDITLEELARRAAQEMLAQKGRLNVNERHCILQLVTKSEGPARLIKAAAAPEATRQNLIQQPAVSQHVERWIGRLYLHRAECPLPVLLHLVQRVASCQRTSKALHQLACIVPISPNAKTKDDLGGLAGYELERNTNGATRIECRSDPPRERRPGHRSRIVEPRIAADELGSIAGHAEDDGVGVEEGDPAGELAVVRISRQQGPACRLNFGHDVHTCLCSQIAQHPLDVASRGKPARPSRFIAYFQHRELDRGVQRNVDPQFRMDPFLAMLEDAVAESMPGAIGRRAASR